MPRAIQIKVKVRKIEAVGSNVLDVIFPSLLNAVVENRRLFLLRGFLMRVVREQASLISHFYTI